MIEITTATETPWQERLGRPLDSELDQSVTNYALPRILNRLEIQSTPRRFSGDAIEFKYVVPRDLAQWVGSHQIALSPLNSNFESLPGIRVFVSEPLRTCDADIIISHYCRDDIERPHFRFIDAFSDSVGLSGGAIHSPYGPVTMESARQVADMEAALYRFSTLPENWDSNGGPKISPDAIAEARTILTAAIERALPAPWVAPGGDAGIGIQWDTESCELYIDIVPDQNTTYVLSPKADGTPEADGVLTMERLAEVLSHIAGRAT